MDWKIVIVALLGSCGFLLTVIGAWIGGNIQTARESIEALNIKLAVVLEKLDGHEHRLVSLETKKRKVN